MATTQLSYSRARAARSVSPPKRRPRILPWDQSTYKSAKPEPSQSTAYGEFPECGSEISTGSDKMDISPLRGRTMKEYDQHLDELRKENFDLKLRLYFLEEKMDKKFDCGEKDLHRTNLQLRIDVEMLQKELAERNKELKALQNMKDDLQKKLEESKTNAAKEIEALEDRIGFLEQKLSSEHKSASSNGSSESVGGEQRQMRDAYVQRLEKDVEEKEADIKALQEKMLKKDNVLRCLITKAKEREDEIFRLRAIMKQNEAAVNAMDGAIQTAIYQATVASRKGDKTGVAEARESLKSAIKEASS